MMPNVAALRHATRALVMSFALLGTTSCIDEEGAARKRIAGDYVRQFGGDNGRYFVRHVLTLRPDGTWRQTSSTHFGGKIQSNPADSGTYRILGVTLNLRSLAAGGAPYRYTMLGDTLFSANAAMAYRYTGYDIGEDTLVRHPVAR